MPKKIHERKSKQRNGRKKKVSWYKKIAAVKMNSKFFFERYLFYSYFELYFQNKYKLYLNLL